MFQWLKVPLNWLARNLSGDGSSSNSRAIQSIVVVDIVAMLWIVLAKSGWIIANNTMTVMVTLITVAGVSYVGGKKYQQGDAQ